MKKALKAKWLKALRSGKYRQGQGRLHSKGKYCCLGVLAEQMGAEWVDISGQFLRPFHKDKAVDAKLEIGNYLRPGFCGINLATQKVLGSMNDGHFEPQVKFKKIADWVEENIKVTA